MKLVYVMSKGKIIICPNEQKLRILKEQSKSSSFSAVTFFTKEEFFKKYYFDYDERLYFYLMKKYHWDIDVCRTYLSYFYVVDENRKYQNSKLQFLQSLKKELKEENLLLVSPVFLDYLKDKEIEIQNYYHLEKYEEEVLSYSFLVSDCSLDKVVYSFSTMKEEVNFVCLEILKLIKDGIPLSKIFLGNVSEDYYYTLKKLFSYYHIPIMIPFRNSIYSSKVVLEYLKTNQLDLEDSSKREMNEKLVSILNDLVEIDLEDEVGKKILLDKIQHTYFDIPCLENAVQIRDIFQEKFQEDEYVFVMGFNQDVLPKSKKDIDYLTDQDKKEVSLFSTKEWNEKEKKITIYVLSQIPNLYLSYKRESPFQKFYPSSLIQELSLKEISHYEDSYQYSDLYNQLRLGEQLDQYYLYGEENETLWKLFSSYEIPYHTYDNSFTGISHDLYLENLPYPLRLSYTSMNAYYECKFKYYIQSVLQIRGYEDTFASFIGSMYHKILSLWRKTGFDFEKEYQAYLEKRELSLKERLLLVRIRRDLLSFIDVLKKQQLLTGYDEELCERKVVIPMDREVSVEFVGYIDKIMYYQNIEDTYFSIIDYKTGTIDTHIEPMKYGLHMQLAVYLYLIHYGRVFQNPIFTGIYYQNILFPYPTWSLKLEKEKQERYYLNGYSTNQVDVLARFDSTYLDSTYIKSMKYQEDKGFGTYTKTIDEDTLYRMVDFTKNKIEEARDSILDADFSINPKKYDGKNISCEFCSFKDLCYQQEKDVVYLDKVDDLSFLGGEE